MCMKAGLATSLSIVGVLATGGAALVLNSSILDTASTAKGSPALATVVGLNDQATNLDVAGGAAGGSVTASGLADVVNGVEAPMSVDEPASLVPAGSSSTSPGTTLPAKSNSNSDASQSVTQNDADVAVDEPTTSVAFEPPATPSTTPTVTVAPTTTTAPSIDKQFTINGIATVTVTAENGKLSVKAIDIFPGSGYKVTNQYSHDGDDVRVTFTSSSRTVEFSARLVRGQIVAAVGNPRNGNLMPPPPGDDHGSRKGDDHDGDRDTHERENDDD